MTPDLIPAALEVPAMIAAAVMLVAVIVGTVWSVTR